MAVKDISFLSSLEDVIDVESSNIDVFVELEDGSTYTVVVATAKNIEYLMDKGEMNYFKPGHPFVIVKTITKDIIEETIQACLSYNKGYWLKLYHFVEEINDTVFDKLQAEQTAEQKEFIELKRLDEWNEFLNFTLH